MEDVLDVYAKPYDPQRPVVCVDEGGKQLIGDVRPPLPIRPGRPARHDSEYVRGGVANVFMAFEPLAGQRHVAVTDSKTSIDFARLLRTLSDEHYPHVQRVVLVCDNLNTHTPAALYEAFAPAEARRPRRGTSRQACGQADETAPRHTPRTRRPRAGRTACRTPRRRR